MVTARKLKHMNPNTEVEMKRLQELQSKYAAVNAAIVEARNTIVRCHRGISDARVNALLRPEDRSPKETESVCRRLESEMKAAEAEIQKQTPEAEVLSGAIAQLEREVVPRRHAERLKVQIEMRERYMALARRLVKMANEFDALNAEAKAAYDNALIEFPADATCGEQDLIRRAAGLSPIWDSGWVSPDWPRREVVVGAVYDFDRSLIDEKDPVAKRKLHQEQHRQRECARQERERLQRQGVIPPDPCPNGPTLKVQYPEPIRSWKNVAR